MNKEMPVIVFVTGKLAAPGLSRVVESLGKTQGFVPLVSIQKISVAALMTTDWLMGKLTIPVGTSRVVLPGSVSGDPSPLAQKLGVPVEKGPLDFLDLPDFFAAPGSKTSLHQHRIEILAEINHANRLSRDDILRQARTLRRDGADVIDLGSTPGEPWTDVDESVRSLVEAGFRVSIDSFDRAEVESAVRAGAELVLSVNADNVQEAKNWGVEVVVIPDHTESNMACIESLGATIEQLDNTPFRIDPILEPIGLGFGRSLGRFLAIRDAFPQASMMMGVGNVTELTSVDSAGVNALLMGFCEENRIESVLTTQVINWARSSVAELDVARKLMHAAVAHGRIPKNLDDRLVMLRDARLRTMDREELRRLQKEIRDPNIRLFANQGEIVAMNADLFEHDADAFALFERLGITDPSHAFYLGWEMMKATLALQLGKKYTQDQALQWGLLTRAERTRHERSEVRGDNGS